MSTTTNQPIIVVTEERRRRRGMLWLGVGAVTAIALAGGGTFALWSDSLTLSGGSITAGNLDIAQVGSTQLWDVSDDRTDALEGVPGTGMDDTDTDGPEEDREWLMGHKVTSDWRAVPGDKVLAEFQADVTLVGDNLVAALSVDGLNNATDAIETMGWSFQIYFMGQPVTEKVPLVLGDATETVHLMYLSATGFKQADGGEEADPVTELPIRAADIDEKVVPMDLIATFDPANDEKGPGEINANTLRFTVLLFGDFDPDETTDQEYVTETDVLSVLKLTLEQVRIPGIGNFPTSPPEP
jgi:predicted ribosomally synthesized peptide with SipW-like signal peptide